MASIQISDPLVTTDGKVNGSVNDASISADEIALYDRQIRLWGVQAQENIRKANILLIRLKALANEVAKNLVLAGIRSITVIDHENVTEHDLGAQFFVSEATIGQNRAEAAVPEIQRLNPRVKVAADTDDITQKADLASYLGSYDLVIATDLDFSTNMLISAACRLASQPSYVAGTHGMYGYIFADLIRHDFTVEREKFNAPSRIGPETLTRSIISTTTKRDKELKEIVVKQEDYTPFVLANTSPLPQEILKNRRKLKQVTPLLPCLRALWEFEKEVGRPPSSTVATDLKLYTTKATEKHRELQLPIESLKSDFLRSFMQSLGAELSPVAAVLGGMLAQDAINVLGKREQPIQNLVLFDGEEYAAPMYALHPIFNDGLDAVVAGAVPDLAPIDLAGSNTMAGGVLSIT